MASMEQIYVRRTDLEVIGQVFRPLPLMAGESMGPLCKMLPFFGFCFSMLCLLVFLHFFATNYKLNISDEFRGVHLNPLAAPVLKYTLSMK